MTCLCPGKWAGLAHQVIGSPGDQLTRWSAQLQTQRKDKVRSAEGEDRKVAREGEGGQPLSIQQALGSAQTPCREARGHQTGTTTHPLHWLRLQAILSEGILFLPWPRLPNTSATTPALLPCSPCGKPPLEMVLQCWLCLISAARSASSNGPCWKCRLFRASAALKMQGLKQGCMFLLEAVVHVGPTWLDRVRRGCPPTHLDPSLYHSSVGEGD